MYRTIKNPKMSHIFNKTLVLSIVYDKFGKNDEKIFQEAEATDILNIPG